ncbi:MAG TPA: AI-2E family transporter, partial [Epsilonproteobacteria bacterium]|nr:AI-2E family transporter [Campylobacterota bacterium]
RKISAAISTLFLIVIVFAPIVYLATVGVSYVAALDVKAVNTIFLTIRGLADGITFLDEWSDTVLSDQKVTAYIQTFTSYVTTAGTVGLGFIKNMFLVLVFFFMINFYGERFFDLIRALIPISRIKSAKMIHEISSTMEVVLYSIIATAIFEGVLFGVMMNVLGFDGLLLGLLYGFASLIPIIGGAILWVPMSLYAWSQGEVNTAILIALYSIIMISIIADTFIKPIIIKVIKEDLLKSTIKINEIVIFFSILAGMTTYGFWGMILGPAITSFLIAITKVYIDYNKSEQLR